MSEQGKETAAEFAQWSLPCIHHNPLSRRECLYCIRHYGDLRAAEERERVKGELRCEEAEAIGGLSDYCTRHGVPAGTPGFNCRDCFKEWKTKVIQTATQHGIDKGKAERASTGFQIRFDGPPGPEAGRFVETETLDGKGIRMGEWVQDGDYWLLRIPRLDEQ